MTEKHFDKVYTLENVKETRAFYDDWAQSYDTDLDENGYATPRRTAKALGKYLADRTVPVLDFGCGTGLGGAALAAEGFTTLDGMDPSEEMLARARDKGIYRDLTVIDPDDDSPVEDGAYAAIAAIGVIGAGAAPLSVFDTLMQALPKGGFFAFSFNDHTRKDGRSRAKINEWVDSGAGRLLHAKHGPHLPAQNLKSSVYIIEKS